MTVGWGSGKVQDELTVSLYHPVAPAEPKTVLDALQQRLNRYREAGSQARASGDERKARMHDRIAKVSPPLLCPACLLSHALAFSGFLSVYGACLLLLQPFPVSSLPLCNESIEPQPAVC